MTLQVERARVRSLDVDRNEITWEVSSGTQDVLDFTFQVVRSESPEGPFDPITPEFEDRYLYIDSRIPSGDKFRQLWYRIKLRHKATDTTTDTASFTNEADPDLVAAYIRRVEQAVFAQVTGRACWLFKRRTFGTRCPSCWDSTTGRRTRSSCLTCYDTGYLRGYLNPIEIYAQIDPSAKTTSLMPQQKNQEVLTQARMTFYPNVSPEDVIVEAENKRWRVVTASQTERLRAPVHQELTLRQINNTDVEYKLPLNLDTALRDLQASPARMFVNATTFGGNILEATPDVFALYSTRPRNAKE